MIDILNHNFYTQFLHSVFTLSFTLSFYTQFYTNYLVQGLAIDLLGEGLSRKTSQQTQ